MAQPPEDTRRTVMYVDKTNTNAIRCYTAAGFSVAPVREKYVGAMEMRRDGSASRYMLSTYTAWPSPFKTALP